MRALLFALLVPGLALADGAWYSPEAVTQASTTFLAGAQKTQAAFSPLEKALSTTDRALADLDLALDLGKAGVAEQAHTTWEASLEARSATLTQEFKALQLTADEHAFYFEQEFVKALKRAVENLRDEHGDIAECTPKRGIMAGPGQAGAATGCEGEDVSAAVARALDADAELRQGLEEHFATDWPAISTYQQESPALAVAGVAPTGWVNPAHLGQLLPELDELVDAIDARGDAARQKLRARKGLVDPEAADAQQKVKAIADAAKELRLWLDEQRQGAGALLFEGVERARKKGKKAGLAAVGYCLNPGAWGGCQGEDRTDEVLALLEGDKRLLKSLQKALEELGEPEL